MMVFGPTAILRFSLIAARTSDSHTNVTGRGGGLAGAGVTGAGTSEFSQLYPPDLLEPPRRERNRSTTPAAGLATTEGVTGAGVWAHPHEGPPPAVTAIPRDARYRSTACVIAPRSAGLPPTAVAVTDGEGAWL